MKIAISQGTINAASYTRGVGAYTRELLGALQKHFPADQFLSVTGNPYQSGADLVHFPFFDPYFLTLPLRQPLPTVVTIHDAIPLKYPEHFPAGTKGKLKWRLQLLASKRVSEIITDSHASRSDICRIFGLPADRIAVIPLAPATNRGTSTIESKVKAEYHLPRRFILYVGDVNWNKNIPGLIRAFNQLESEQTHLVLVGKVFSDQPDIPEYQAVKGEIAAGTKSKLIHTLGYVPSHHLPVIYRLATLYVQPSFDEGFGFPVLEAMKEGCPVLSSQGGSLPEVAGKAALYFDPQVPKNFVKELNHLLSDPTLRKSLVEKGKQHVKNFTWGRTARLTHHVYEKVLAR